MFEDVYEARPNLKEEIRDSVLQQMDDAIEQAGVVSEEQVKAINLYKVYIEEQLDDIVQMYVDNFTIEELVVVLNWTESDLGKKTTKFSSEKIMPIVFNTLEKVAMKMYDEEMKTEFGNCLDSKIGQSCTLEDGCLCGCEDGDPDEDSEIVFLGAELET